MDNEKLTAKEILALSPDQINRLIAGGEGYTVHEKGKWIFGEPHYRLKDPDGNWVTEKSCGNYYNELTAWRWECPKFSTDLNFAIPLKWKHEICTSLKPNWITHGNKPEGLTIVKHDYTIESYARAICIMIQMIANGIAGEFDLTTGVKDGNYIHDLPTVPTTDNL